MRRVDHEPLPLQHGDLLRNARGHDAVEMRVQRGDARRNRKVELKEVHVVSAPGQGLAVGRELHANYVLCGAIGLVRAGDPLRRDEVEWAGFHGNQTVGVVELARPVGEVRCDLNGNLLGEGGGGKEYGENRAGDAGEN
jgi:hypothetical protein